MPDLAGEEVTLSFYLTLDDNGKGLLQPVRAIDNMEDASSIPTRHQPLNKISRIISCPRAYRQIRRLCGLVP